MGEPHKILIVGCGAVGQVFGLALQKAGVELGIYDRPEVLQRLQQARESGGLPVYQLSYFHRRHPLTHRLVSYQALSDVDACREFNPDQIWFATPSPLFYSAWFREFLGQVPSERVVCFAPEGARDEFYPESIDRERFVFGGITFMSWQANLEGDPDRPDGVTFWRPPLLGIPLVGSEKACRQVGALLKSGEMRFEIQKPGYQKSLASITAVMSSFVAGLELAGWSMRAFRRSAWLGRAAHAAREGVLSQAPGPGIITRALQRVIFSTAGFYLVSLFLPLIFPFNLEKYLQFHYTKTREQTLSLLDLFARDGEKRSLPVGNIRALLQALQDQD